MLVSWDSISALSSITVDVSREPLFRGEEAKDVSAFFLDVFLLIFDLPLDRLGLLEDVAGGVVTMKFISGSEPACGFGRTVVMLVGKLGNLRTAVAPSPTMNDSASLPHWQVFKLWPQLSSGRPGFRTSIKIRSVCAHEVARCPRMHGSHEYLLPFIRGIMNVMPGLGR